MYYRLGLYKIDKLCSNETANLLKVTPPSLMDSTDLVECVNSTEYSIRPTYL
jgi:hypothetical protein